MRARESQMRTVETVHRDDRRPDRGEDWNVSEWQDATYVEHALLELGSGGPGDIHPAIVEYYWGRKQRADGLPRMGELVLPLFASIFGVAPCNRDLVATPWAWIYVSALMLDDSVDMGEGVPATASWCRGMLIRRAQQRLNRVLSPSAELLTAFDRYRAESVAAMRDESHPRLASRETPPIVTALVHGRKAAVAKSCAAALVYAEAGKGLSEREELGVEYLCAGIQQLDDLHDFAEDWTGQRRSLVLREVEEWLGRGSEASAFGRRESEMLRAALLCSRAIGRTWALSALLLRRSIALLDPEGTSSGGQYVLALASRCDEFNGLMAATEDRHSEDLRMAEEAGWVRARYDVLCQRVPGFGDFLREAGALLADGPMAAN